jgi:hypothetical protein
MYAELTAGYHIDPQALINDVVFSVSELGGNHDG